MSNIFINAGAIAVIFFIAKFIEMRFIEQENKPLKVLIKDSLIVYICVLSGYYIIEQLSPMIQNGGEVIASETTAVFTGNPDF
jgi:hypothetical protein